MKTEVHLSKLAEKQLKKVPDFIAMKFFVWVHMLDQVGLLEVRKSKGYHDEPLKGDRLGQRSIRLNRSYRALYKEMDSSLEIIEVIEVNKHEY